MSSSLDAMLTLGKAFNLHNDPVFLIVFILLSYKRLMNQYLAPTLGSTFVTVFISAACAQLAPFVYTAASPYLPPPSPPPIVPAHDYPDEPAPAAPAAPATPAAPVAPAAANKLPIEHAERLLSMTLERWLGN
jgi:hypothetical protein